MKNSLYFAAIVGAALMLGQVVNASEPLTKSTIPSLVKITKEVQPIFPARLLRRGVIRGEAVVAISLDNNGKLSDCLVARYTHPDFAEAALDAIRQWEFRLQEPGGVVMDVVFKFRVDGMVVVEHFAGDDTPAQARVSSKFVYRPCAPGDLDRRLVPTHVVLPDYPAELKRQRVEGTVAIDFYIDESGRARLPVSLNEENTLLSSLATAAVEQWKFEPPIRAGKPVLVHLTHEFSFVADE